jgi:hypothetical protein
MRIGSSNDGYLASIKGEDRTTTSKEEVVDQIKNNILIDVFENNARGTTYDDIVNHFSSSSPLTGTPKEIVGKANSPEISEEALKMLRQKAAAAETKSDKKD